MSWKPIESAPLQGTCIVTNGYLVGEAKYLADYEGWWWVNCVPTDPWDGQVVNPTFWQELPEPPK